MPESVTIALIAGLSAAITAIITGMIAALASRRNKSAEAYKTVIEADEILTRVRAAQLENDGRMYDMVQSLRIEMLANERRCTDRIDALEHGRNEDKRQLAAARQLQLSLENEIAVLRERYEGQIMQLQAENVKLKAQLDRLASRVETGELASGKHDIPKG